jgi:peptidoglycan/xylan/chitin deacetylase (PgdA/CDA1 family)
MSADELREAERQGMEIGSHGHVHLDLSRATQPEAEGDLSASVERLKEVLGRPPRYLAYPYGHYSDDARHAAAAQFEAAFSIDKPHDGHYAFERVQITRLDGRLVFALKTSGHYPWLRRSRVGSGAYAVVRPLIVRSRRQKN